MRGGLDGRAVPSGQRLGSAIVATFGLVYVEVNAGALPSVIAGVARIVGAVLFIVVAALLLAGRHSSPTDGTPARQGFGRGYWVVVGVEVAAIVVGARLLTGPLGLPHSVVAWISVVVGAHFVALARVWQIRRFHVLGATIALCGAAGLAAAGAGASDAVVAGTGGVIPGALLLASGGWGAAWTLTAQGRAQPLRTRGAAKDVSSPIERAR